MQQAYGFKETWADYIWKPGELMCFYLYFLLGTYLPSYSMLQTTYIWKLTAH